VCTGAIKTWRPGQPHPHPHPYAFGLAETSLSNGARRKFNQLVQKRAIHSATACRYREFYQKVRGKHPEFEQALNKKDRLGKTLLHAHCSGEDSSVEVVERLVMQGALVQTTDNAGMAPLHDAG
jgi:hypothetical protein